MAALRRRRGLLALAAAVLAAAVIAVLVTTFDSDSGGEQPRRTSTTIGADGTEFGFNSGIDDSDSTASLTRFRADVDNLVAHGQTWVRFGIASWLVAPGGDVDGISWSQQGLAEYDSVVAYAKHKGLHVFLVTSGAPDWAQDYSFSDYQKVSTEYWRFLAQRYKDEVTVWQVFNEADGSDYRQFTPNRALDDSYLSQLKTLIGAAAGVIHQANPAIVVTTNASGYPMNDAQQARWFRYFDGLAPVLDMVTVDVYPETNSTEIEKLGDRIAALRARYGKPVSVGEVGLPTCAGCDSENDQRTYMPRAINSLEQGDPALILYYELRDSGGTDSNGASGFGILYADGTPKKSYDAIMHAMRASKRS